MITFGLVAMGVRRKRPRIGTSPEQAPDGLCRGVLQARRHDSDAEFDRGRGARGDRGMMIEARPAPPLPPLGRYLG